MPKEDADVLEVLIGEMAKCRGVDPILGKPLGVLPETELLKPVGNMLHLTSSSGQAP